MSQEQPRRPQDVFPEQEPIKYGDVFQVSGDLADKPIVPQDADMMQTRGGQRLWPAPGGWTRLRHAGSSHHQRESRPCRRCFECRRRYRGCCLGKGLSWDPRYYGICRWAVGQYYQGVEQTASTVGGAVIQTKITIDEALEATARTAGNKPVDQSDAAAIQAAEVRATGTHFITRPGLRPMPSLPPISTRGWTAMRTRSSSAMFSL
ncbi:seed maturation protein [Actinidia rufa]|uniref:Seed maturation protein n=1 Tax=Actinidia rufa TaxID=165716 RepID=A0A7J0GDG9_9ERIC|nr:seed maturation protein [Actinidia rufa]